MCGALLPAPAHEDRACWGARSQQGVPFFQGLKPKISIASYGTAKDRALIRTLAWKEQGISFTAETLAAASGARALIRTKQEKVFVNSGT